MSRDMLKALGALLAALADETRDRVRVVITSRLGSAGTVTLGVDVSPQLLSVEDRDMILTFAARLANWDHA